MSRIKEYRLDKALRSYPDLRVGDCVPFYFCPRSVMLFVIHKGNQSGLAYQGGQDRIVHLEADLRQTVDWADSKCRRWAFTPSNAATRYSADFSDLNDLAKIDWNAVEANWWSGPDVEPTVQDRKQAEFLVEESITWDQVSRIGVKSSAVYFRVQALLREAAHRPTLEITPSWYY